MQSEILGIIHTHDKYNSSDGFWDYGYEYKSRFFTMKTKPSYRIKRVGPEYCLASDEGKCNSVQMIMSMVEMNSGDVYMSVGVGDCESIVSIWTWEDIKSWLPSQI